MTAIDETQKAIDAIAANKTDQALSAIERATGKINILLARNPATALIPVGLQVEVIDAAPHDSKDISEVAQNASRAVEDKNYPAARVLLYALTSEIRVRTYNLPLATYPLALQEAAHLLDEKRPQDADNVLLTALNTLAAVDRVTPLPLVLARKAMSRPRQRVRPIRPWHKRWCRPQRRKLSGRKISATQVGPENAALNADISNLEKQ